MNAAIAYVYFRIGGNADDTPGLSQDNFTAQISEIANKDNNYNPSRIDDVLAAQKAHEPLPLKTILLTFDGTDITFLHNALPLLQKHNLPYAVFISPGMLDNAEKTQSDDTMHWDDIRTILKDKNATIGLSAYNYGHMDGKTVEDISADLNRARVRFREELQQEPLYFAYPFGEYSDEYIAAVTRQNFAASFGQQSGVIAEGAARTTLPRFTMTDDFSDMDRFRLTSVSLPFPVTSVHPSATIVDKNPPAISFTIASSISRQDISKLTCFASGVGKLETQTDKSGETKVKFPAPFEDNKGRVNCTLPAPPLDGSDDPRWRWLGFLFSMPESAAH